MGRHQSLVRQCNGATRRPRRGLAPHRHARFAPDGPGALRAGKFRMSFVRSARRAPEAQAPPRASLAHPFPPRQAHRCIDIHRYRTYAECVASLPTIVRNTGVAASCCIPKAKSRSRSKDLKRFASLFRVLADETRLQIIGMLAAAKGELCVCEIEASIAHLSQPTISHHLKLLREEGLVTAERRGTWVYYRLGSELVDRLRSVAERIE